MRYIRIFAIVFLISVIIATGFFIYSITAHTNSETDLLGLLKVDPFKSFSVVVLPDTQFYSASHSDILCSQTEWISNHIKDLNIVFVSHLGDIVNDGSDVAQWENASGCLKKLDGIVPYSVVPGNHDADKPGNKLSSFSNFLKYFGGSRFESFQNEGGFIGNGNHYQVISANGMRILFLGLEVEPSDEVLNWARGITQKNNGLYSIVTTHKYLPVDSEMPENALSYREGGHTGKGIWDELVYGNCSVAMIWSGHFHGENRADTINFCGTEVHQIVQDYQSRENGGNGWLRIYVFTPAEQKIEVYTYSPLLRSVEKDTDSRFSLGITDMAASR